VSVDYEKLLRQEGASASSGAVVAPLLRLYLTDGRFPKGRKVEIPGGDPSRKPDGWFHPSSHPTMPARKLYHYLAEPDRWEPEPFEAEMRMSVTIGSLMHGVVRMALEDIGLWQAPVGLCPACNRPYGPGAGECDEPGVCDPVLGRRGHMDGVLLTPQLGMTGYDLKTINHFAVQKLPDMDVEFLKVKYPYYYGQFQDYMAMSGLRTIIVVFAGMGFPWTFKEVHVPYDEQYVVALEAKYRAVRQAVAEGTPPAPCCEFGSKQSRACPAMACAMKR
jgi:hypothetical protein